MILFVCLKRNIYLVASNLTQLNSFNTNSLLIINSSRSDSSTPNLARFMQYVQKNISIQFELPKLNPTFEVSSYELTILDKTPANTCILAIEYKHNEQLSNFNLHIDQESNAFIQNYFYLKHSSELKLVYLMTKTWPIPNDLPEISFIIRFANRSVLTGSHPQSYTKIDIKIVTNMQNSTDIVITKPAVPNTVVFTKSDNKAVYLIYDCEALKPNANSRIAFTILNPDLGFFYMSENNSIFIYPVKDINVFRRKSFMVRFSLD